MRRVALYALAIVLFGASQAVVPWFTPDQALRALVHDDPQVADCIQQDAKGVRSGISVQAIASHPQLALVEMEETCICGAQNCPFWVYRVDAGGSHKLINGFTIGVQTVAQSSGPPDIIAKAHDSALVSDVTHFAYRHGTYVVAEAYRVRNDNGKRKPNEIEIKFAPGSSQERISGTVSPGWDDIYKFSASAGQHLKIAGSTSHQRVDVRLFPTSGKPIDVTIGNVQPITLPQTGTYHLTVEPAGMFPDGNRYDLMVSIR